MEPIIEKEKILKRSPYGVSDFDHLRRKNCYYVDKTRFIPIIEDKGFYLFFIRPRRFGKSLFLSILQLYYDIDAADRFDTLFEGTYIGSNPTPERNSYMVLSFNFSGVSSNLDEVKESFLINVQTSILRFLKKYRNHFGADLDEFLNKINSINIPSALLDALLGYCWSYKVKLYITIDEYDNFANTILTTAGKKSYLAITHGEGFLRAFFNVFKSGTTGADAPISRLFITGVSPITLDDVTSGFNIGTNISLAPDLNEMLGFTGEEVENILNYYHQAGKTHHPFPELMAIFEQWFNNYRFAKKAQIQMFNPVQLLHFMDYYINYAAFPDSFIDRNFRIDYHKLRHFIILDKQGAQTKTTNGNFSVLMNIIEKGTITSELIEGFPIEEMMNTENFISLLYYFGLLTITGTTPRNTAILSIPNETVKQLYYDYIKDTYVETQIFSMNMRQYTNLIGDMAFEGNWKPLFQFLGERIDAASGLRDLLQGEKTLQTFLNVYLGLSDYLLVYSEKELNKGFADLVLEPNTAQYPVLNHTFLIEIKYISKGEGEPSAEEIKKRVNEARQQLNRYRADERFQKRLGKSQLIEIVLVFCGHRLIHME